jgi:hypothetical protein
MGNKNAHAIQTTATQPATTTTAQPNNKPVPTVDQDIFSKYGLKLKGTSNLIPLNSIGISGKVRQLTDFPHSSIRLWIFVRKSKSLRHTSTTEQIPSKQCN